MSSDEQPTAPRTRAEARAAREAASQVSSGPSTGSRTQGETSGSQEQPVVERAEGPSTGPGAQGSGARRFLFTLAAALGILGVIGAAFAVVSLLQGPRLAQATVDPAQAIEVASTLTFTANQALAAVDPSQVSIEPAVPFTASAEGRSVSIHFSVPLDDRTDYTVRVDGVAAAGGGPSATFTESFTTPAAEIFLLRRSVEEPDTIFRTDLSGENAVPVFQHERINDFRATTTELVVAVEEDERSQLLVITRDGSQQPRELTLPGDGYVGEIQVSDRGGLVGYAYSDRELTEETGRASVLATQPLDGSAEPQVISIDGAEANALEWRFVPDSASALFIDFDGGLILVDAASGQASELGIAATIQGVTAETAIVERGDGAVTTVNLADGAEQPLAASDPDYGPAETIAPFPGGTLRHVIARADDGMPLGQAVIRVDDDGAAAPLVEIGGADAIVQVCTSPSGQYAAVVMAPALAANSFDDMLLPLPENLETHLIDIRTGDELVALTGFDASWCAVAPRF